MPLMCCDEPGCSCCLTCGEPEEHCTCEDCGSCGELTEWTDLDADGVCCSCRQNMEMRRQDASDYRHRAL